MKACLIFLLVGFFSFFAHAENWTVAGKTYHAVFVVKKMDTGLIISSLEGTAIVHFADLPADQQKKFGYDPAAAALALAKKHADEYAAANEPLNYTDVLALLDRVGSGQYDRFKEYYSYSMTPTVLLGKDGEYKVWINCLSNSDHLCKESVLRISIERVGDGWLWMDDHDVTMIAGRIKYTPASDNLTKDVLNGGDVMEIENFDVPANTLRDMSEQNDWAVQVGFTELDLKPAFSAAAGAFTGMLQVLPRANEPVPAAQSHTARFNSINVSDPTPAADSTASSTPDPAPSTGPSTFNPGSIDAPVTGR